MNIPLGDPMLQSVDENVSMADITLRVITKLNKRCGPSSDLVSDSSKHKCSLCYNIQNI